MKKLLSTTAAAFFICANVHAAPMNLNVHNADLRSVIYMVARDGNLNVSVDDSVDGKISISLNGIEPKKALDIIAKTKNLRIFNDSEIFIITAYANTSLMKTYILPVRYGDAENFREAIIMSLNGQISINNKDDFNEDYNSSTNIKTNPDGSTTISTEKKSVIGEKHNDSNRTTIRETIIKAEDRVKVNLDTNTIILFGTEAEYERVKNLLENLDVELKQVSVEAQILAIDKNASKNLGIDWFWSTLPQYPNYSENYTPPTLDNEGNVLAPGYITENYSPKSNDTTGYGIIRFGRSPTGNPYEFYYGARINALIENGKGKILSRPNVTTIQGHEAIIHIGNSVPVSKSSTTNSTTTTSFDYRDVGITLKYTPRVNVDGTITAVIHTEVSTPQYIEDLKAYRFYTRSADTTVTVRDGQPMVIGGLIGAEDAKSVSKIPFLGDLPILGALFRNHKKNKSESELMIFLTAHVINGAGVGVPKNVRYSTPAGNLPHEFLTEEK